jgi:hypothetical protein
MYLILYQNITDTPGGVSCAAPEYYFLSLSPYFDQSITNSHVSMDVR